MGGHGSGKGGQRRWSGKGSSGGARKGGNHHQRDKHRPERRRSRHEVVRHDRHDNNGDYEDIDVDINKVCNDLNKLPDCDSTQRRGALTKLYNGPLMKRSQAIARKYPPDSDEGLMLQSALETGMPFMPNSKARQLLDAFSDAGYELQWDPNEEPVTRSFGTAKGNNRSGHSNAPRGSDPRLQRELHRERSDRSDRQQRAGSGSQASRNKSIRSFVKNAPIRFGHRNKKKGQRQGRGHAEDGEDHRRGDTRGRQGGKGGRGGPKKTRRGKEDFNRPGTGAKRGRTGANTIDVHWSPPRKEGDEEKVDGVTPKSMPTRPPKSLSPVRGPKGRGKTQILPAWMTASPEGASPAILDRAASPAISDRAPSPPTAAAGRGRGSAEPSWKKAEKQPPSIPPLEDDAKDSSKQTSPAPDKSAEDALESFFQERKDDARREDDNGWQEREEKPVHKRDRGDGWSERPWARGKTVRPPARPDKSIPAPPPRPLRELLLVCSRHGKKRNWTMLVQEAAGTGKWICRDSAPCEIFFDRGDNADEVGKSDDESSPSMPALQDKETLEALCDRQDPPPEPGASSVSNPPKKARLTPRQGAEDLNEPESAIVPAQEPEPERQRHRREHRARGEDKKHKKDRPRHHSSSRHPEAHWPAVSYPPGNLVPPPPPPDSSRHGHGRHHDMHFGPPLPGIPGPPMGHYPAPHPMYPPMHPHGMQQAGYPPMPVPGHPSTYRPQEAGPMNGPPRHPAHSSRHDRHPEGRPHGSRRGSSHGHDFGTPRGIPRYQDHQLEMRIDNEDL